MLTPGKSSKSYGARKQGKSPGKPASEVEAENKGRETNQRVVALTDEPAVLPLHSDEDMRMVERTATCSAIGERDGLSRLGGLEGCFDEGD